ncbi:hypothetical protein [Mycobacterium haemophilum]|uniref:Transmembrane protein n=2 Tax=Mycobacterium haemophilum TaxID=29311 RepID=A0A0I9TSP5_9MYCO|nr:hypothetical protein [Mycobacterium haemophilum]KLO32786.1 transmembrane protein [Mycobacterium haemophilum]KLO37088.1 transmembrane protein [Mycobacterium haemophilum]KLO43561.1 transmembrane protein [Mycobacterium haemophilum]KLO55919.1 transmembrane protein [Mycobacterium haemophilum]
MTAITLVPARTAGHVRAWCATTTLGSARWQQGLGAFIAAALFWPKSSIDPIVGLDPSWQAGLALARIHHIAWGPELVFTYGPLGFLQTSAYYSFAQAVLASIYQITVIAALFLGIATALRQRHAPMTSLIGAFVTTGIAVSLHVGNGFSVKGSLGMWYPELAVLAAFAWASASLLQHEPKRSTVFTTCTALGAVAGFQLLVKLSSGLSIVVIALAVSVLLGWRAVGRHCATLVTFVASIPIWWLLAGQQPGDLPTWLKLSAAIVSGYVDAMATVPLPPNAALGVLLSLAWTVALGVMFARGRPEIPRRFVVLVAIVTLIAGKEAFGRFDLWHFSILLGVIVVALAITPLTGTRRRRGYVVAALAITLASANIYASAVYDRAVAVVQAPMQVVDRLATLALPGRLGQRIEQAKADQRTLYAIPSRFITTIGSAPVHIDPQEISAAWAYDLTWRPTPVFQTYSAYNPTLDHLNSESLANKPQFVLSRLSPASPATGIDGRLGVQESPQYSRALLCDYTVNGIENRWALLTRTTPHCGPLTPLSTVPLRENDTIMVPAPSEPDMAVLVGIDLDQTIADRLFAGTIAPLTNFTVLLNGITYRLVAKNAAEPFLVTTPASVAGTNLQIHAHAISVGRTVNLGQPLTTARLRFYEMRVKP